MTQSEKEAYKELPQYCEYVLSSDDVTLWSSMSLGQIQCVSTTCSVLDIALLVVEFPQVTPSNMLLITGRFENVKVLYVVHKLNLSQFVKL